MNVLTNRRESEQLQSMSCNENRPRDILHNDIKTPSVRLVKPAFELPR